MHIVVEKILDADDLPSPPGIALKILEIYSDPDIVLDDLTSLISSDPVVAAKLLEYCNSPLFARSRETTTIQQAVVLLGLRAVKTLALSFSLTQTGNGDSQFDYDEFWNRCIAIAVSSKALAERKGIDGDQAFLQGLLVSIGQIGLAHVFPGTYLAMLREHQETGADLLQLEKDCWQINHLEISSAILNEWNFPSKVLEAIELIAGSSGLSQVTSPQILLQVQVLEFAQHIADAIFVDVVDVNFVADHEEIAANWFDISPDEFVVLFDEVSEAWAQYASLLKFDTSKAISFSQLERKARKGIAYLSLDVHAENDLIRAQNEELKQNAMVDSLTGLKNRRAYLLEGKSEWERASRLQKSFILAMVDIDRFKAVNDTYGHAVGDDVLIAVAKSLKTNARQYDSIYRLGGEEFVLLIPECEPDFAVGTMERLRTAIEALEFVVGDKTIKITASFGVAVQNVNRPSPLATLLKEADQLLYQAKKEGRNRICTSLGPRPDIAPALFPNPDLPNCASTEEV